MNIDRMNSQSDQSQIAQQNILSIHQQGNNKYISYYEIQKYQAEKLNKPNINTNTYINTNINTNTNTNINTNINTNTNTNIHQNCHPQHIHWNKDAHTQQSNSPINRSNPSQLIIQQIVNQCCLNMKLSIVFGLRKRNHIQITKIRRYSNGASYEEGVKYVIELAMSTLKVQVSIAKPQNTKIWKQMEIPLQSYQPEIINNLVIQQLCNGDIVIHLNDFQFMMNIKLQHIPGLFVVIRGTSNIHSLELDQFKYDDLQDNGGGCTTEKCNIF